MPPNPPILEGNICDPDNITDAQAADARAHHLACQMTDEVRTVTVDASFDNALKGDVILSPGGDGPGQSIAALLRALSPPQYHSHSGLMTSNYKQITHCTAAAERIADHTRGVAGIEGFDPDVLKYAWPGSITQSVQDSIEGQPWIDPDGKLYSISGFTPTEVGIPTGHDDWRVIPPVVVKPFPEQEGAVRTRLHRAADWALAHAGHVDAHGHVQQYGHYYYSFYGYTKPEIALDAGSAAPTSAGWAHGMQPAVCSSFVWLSMKENGLHLVSPSGDYESADDLRLDVITAGAAVGQHTRDGLFLYTQQERQEAAQVLLAVFENMVIDKEGLFRDVPVVSTEVADGIADQIMNMFAFNEPDKEGDDGWKQSGAANAVSPDNIMWWNPPAFGYAEPLQYLPQHTESYTVSRWHSVSTTGSISGTVTYNGRPVAGAHVHASSASTVTDHAGHYTLDAVPEGSYEVDAQTVIDPSHPAHSFEAKGSHRVTLSAAHPDVTADIVLALPVDTFRDLQLVFSISCDHGDWNPWHKHGVLHAGPEQRSVLVNPGNVVANYHYRYTYDDGSYFNVDYDFRTTLAENLSIDVSVKATIRDLHNNIQAQRTTEFNVPKDSQRTWALTVEATGGSYHNGPAICSGTAKNLLQHG